MTTQQIEHMVAARLIERRLTVSTAESCTGGLIAHRLTNIAGSSAYLLGGIVAYSNEMKQKLLHVPEKTLIDYGAVSQQTAAAMAAGALDVFGTDYALSVTGIAGPGGGTAEKPVGLTYIGLAGKDGTQQVERYIWEGDRITNKQSSADAALRLLLAALGGD